MPFSSTLPDPQFYCKTTQRLNIGSCGFHFSRLLCASAPILSSIKRRALRVPSLLIPPTHTLQLEERSMYIPLISTARLDRRGSVNRGGGRNEGDDDKTGGGGGDGRSLYSGESNASSGYGLRISDADGLPKDNNEAKAYGAG